MNITQRVGTRTTGDKTPYSNRERTKKKTRKSDTKRPRTRKFGETTIDCVYRKKIHKR